MNYGDMMTLSESWLEMQVNNNAVNYIYYSIKIFIILSISIIKVYNNHLRVVPYFVQILIKINFYIKLINNILFA